ncbi:hypothetical protein LCGC14_1287080 [marine sediment metagenome]|uniref:Uncharacterized protein n=1 Tax=marine sediment metagenome TaxID=412755 RepID=A0A0F9NWG9_9ZZZZ
MPLYTLKEKKNDWNLSRIGLPISEKPTRAIFDLRNLIAHSVYVTQGIFKNKYETELITDWFDYDISEVLENVDELNEKDFTLVAISITLRKVENKESNYISVEVFREGIARLRDDIKKNEVNWVAKFLSNYISLGK